MLVAVSGDVGGVGRHVIVGGFELGAVNGVSAASCRSPALTLVILLVASVP